jgi:hypothetical protein
VTPEGSPPTPEQPELPLPFPEFTGDMPLLPARMVNEYQYCPLGAFANLIKPGDTVSGELPNDAGALVRCAPRW